MMATNHANKKTVLLRDLLTCSLCLEEMTKSRLLPCHHGYCLNCLQKYSDSSMKDNKLSCPVCRAECTVPEGGVQHFSPNIFIHSLREALDGESEDEESGENEVPTESNTKCDTDDCKDFAVYFCTAGCGYMCLICEVYHSRMKLFRNHRKIDASEVGTKSKQLPFCTRHPNHIVELYCDDCSVPCCATCVVLCHQTHKCCELTTKESTFRANVEGVLVKIDNVSKKTTDAVNSTDQYEKQMETDVDQLIGMTADTFTKLRKQLTHEEESIHQELVQCKLNAQKQIADVRDRQETLKATMEFSKRFGNKMLAKATSYDFATNTDSFVDHVRKTILPGPAHYIWNCCHTIDKAGGNTTFAGVNVSVSGKIEMTLRTRGVMRVLGVTRIDIAMGGDIILCTREKDFSILHAFSPNGEELNNIPTECCIRDMAIRPVNEDSCEIILGGQFYDWNSSVACKEHCICYVKMNRHEYGMSNEGVYKHKLDVKTISLDKNGVALLGCNTNRIHKVEKPSKHSGDIILPDNLKGKEIIPDPDGDGHIFIENSAYRIVWIDSKGQKIKESKETNITCFVSDGQGMLIAISGNHNNSVLVIDDTGATKAHLVPHDRVLVRPHTLCFDKDNHLLYVSGNRKRGGIVILEYPVCFKESVRGHSCAMSITAKFPDL